MAKKIQVAGAGAKQTIPFGVPADNANISAATAANAAAIVAFPADASRGVYISQVLLSLVGSTTPQANLVIEDGSGPTVYLNVDITESGFTQVDLNPPLILDSNVAATVSLGPGGVGVTGKLNVIAWLLN